LGRLIAFDTLWAGPFMPVLLQDGCSQTAQALEARWVDSVAKIMMFRVATPHRSLRGSS
jgi:hypothetical protein